jgi:hypothetical protein
MPPAGSQLAAQPLLGVLAPGILGWLPGPGVLGWGVGHDGATEEAEEARLVACSTAWRSRFRRTASGHLALRSCSRCSSRTRSSSCSNWAVCSSSAVGSDAGSSPWRSAAARRLLGSGWSLMLAPICRVLWNARSSREAPLAERAVQRDAQASQLALGDLDAGLGHGDGARVVRLAVGALTA